MLVSAWNFKKMMKELNEEILWLIFRLFFIYANGKKRG
jgi:hypothetical protein